MSRLDETSPADDRTADPGQHPADPGLTERDRLVETIRNLTHEVLIGRDVEFGLRAEVYRLENQLLAAHNATTETVAEIKRSTTWRVGRTVLRPIALVRRGTRAGGQ